MVLDNSASWDPSGDFSEQSNLVPEIARGVPMIKVLGIGGGGSNAVSRMYKEKLPASFRPSNCHPQSQFQRVTLTIETRSWRIFCWRNSGQ